MIDIGNPLYFCHWLKQYIEEGGKDIEHIRKMVDIPLQCQRGMKELREKEEEQIQAYRDYCDDPYYNPIRKYSSNDAPDCW